MESRQYFHCGIGWKSIDIWEQAVLSLRHRVQDQYRQMQSRQYFHCGIGCRSIDICRVGSTLTAAQGAEVQTYGEQVVLSLRHRVQARLAEHYLSINHVYFSSIFPLFFLYFPSNVYIYHSILCIILSSAHRLASLAVQYHLFSTYEILLEAGGEERPRYLNQLLGRAEGRK